MKGINKILMKANLKLKERKQEHDLHMKIKMPKYMANASFYKPKFRTIDLLTNC